MTEIRKHRGRPPKPHPSILTPEQILALRGGSPQTVETAEEAAARREKDAARKRLERRAAAAEKAVADIESYEQLWQHNRKQLPETELNALLEKQERVWDQLHWTNAVMNGTYDVSPDDTECFVSVEEGAADLFEFVKTHGTVTMELILIPEYWKTPLYAEKFQGSDPTGIFARLGLVISVPGHKLHQFEQYLATRKATGSATAPPGNGYVQMQCTSCTSPTSVESVSAEIAKAYETADHKFLCGGCRAIEAKSRQESVLYQRGLCRSTGELNVI